jgi:hypothetical protein
MSRCAVKLVRDTDIPRAAFPGRLLASLVLVLLGVFAGAPVLAQDISRQQMKGLDEQVQEIKSEVLEIAAELSLLEERLLFPSNTQVALFVAVAEGKAFRLDSVQLRIDGELVAHHIYSAKELEALQKGGVQRIFTGNVPSGQRQLEVAVAGKSAGGRDFSQVENFSFSKGVEPKLVGITLAGPDSGSAAIKVGDW